MNESQHPEPQNHRIDQFEDEIVLMDYLVVIWKWKYLILAGTFLCAVAAAVISFQMPKVYATNTVLQPGILRVTQEGKTMYIDSAQNLKAIIETGTFDNQILRNIDAPNKDDVPKSEEFEVQIPKGSNALEILYKTQNVHLGLQILNNLNKAISERYGKLIKYYQENYDKEIRLKSKEVFKVNEKMTKVKHTISGIEAENEAQISEIANKTSAKVVEISTAEAESEAQIRQRDNKIAAMNTSISAAEAESEAQIKQKDNKIETIKAQIKARKNQIENLRKRISDVKLEVGRISKNTDLLIEQRDTFLSSTEDGGSVLAGMIHANTVHQNIGFLNSLRSTITSTWSQIYQEKVGIERSEINITDLEDQKENMKKQTEFKIENLRSDINDLEDQKENMKKQTQYRIEVKKSETKDLESEKKYKLEQISSLGFMKNSIQNIQIIKPPENSPYPIKPRTRLNVMLAALVGLFLTVFLAFFIEYVSKYNNREHD